MTIKQFFGSKENLVIHCKTWEQANKLCNEFNRLGYKWSSGYSYIFNCWNAYKKDTCYSNKFSLCTAFFYRKHKYKILEFEEIEFEEKEDKQ